MDKLKYIKLENEDGSYSSSIPLAVDSDYVDVNGVALTNELTNKATKTELNTNVSNLQSQISSLASGSPKGAYATTAALVSANPDTGVYIVTTDGHIYSWTKNASSAIDLGIYQAAELEDNSITNSKIHDVSINKINETFEKQLENLLDKDKCELGLYTGHGSTFHSGYTTWQGHKLYAYTTDYISCQANDTFMKNWNGQGREVVFFDSNKDYITGIDAYHNKIVVPNNNSIAYFRATIPVFSTLPSWYSVMKPLEKAMIVKGSYLPDKYIPYKSRFIDYLKSVRNMPRPVIFDTDWYTDVDDAVALGVLVEAEKNGLVDIVAVGASTTAPKTVGSIDAMLTYLGRSNVAIGCDKTEQISWCGQWVQNINDNYPHVLSSDTAEDAVRTYRRALVSTDIPINFIVVGTMRNIYNLLISEPDDITDLPGYDLVAKKVNKFYVMGGKYPSGTEANWQGERSRIYANYFCTHCPVEVVFLGFEVGNTVISGGNILDRYEYDIVAKALHDYLETYPQVTTQGRSSWDPMTTLLGCVEDVELCGYNLVYGSNIVNEETGENVFTADTINNNKTKQAYVVKSKPDKWYEQQLNSILERNTFPTRKDIGQQQIPRVIVVSE